MGYLTEMGVGKASKKISHPSKPRKNTGLKKFFGFLDFDVDETENRWYYIHIKIWKGCGFRWFESHSKSKTLKPIRRF